MLQVVNIKKVYRTSGFVQTALKGVSLAFRDSEFAAILGPSGSGKTTLLNIIGGLDHYDEGDLIIDGISTKEYKARDWDTFRNNRVGFVFQSYNLISHQSVISNVEMALTLSGVDKKERRKRATEVLGKVGLSEHINKKPLQLSGGQMQRVAIARALINDPEILLADEPTGALDSKTSVEVMDLLSEIAKERLVVMVTHNPDLAKNYATRIINLKDGEITTDSNPYLPTQDDLSRVSGKKIRKAQMKFRTALSLSFNNLMSKKGRTVMTAFAGCVGIIGIAAILALSNGVNNYIKTVEEQTLSSYPLQVNKTGMDMSAMMGVSGESETDSSDDQNNSSQGENTEVKQMQIVSSMVEKMSNNDLVALKKWIDGADGETMRNASSYIKYSYNVTPQIYLKNTQENKYRQINPDSTLSSVGMGSDVYGNSTLSSMMSSNIFDEMIDQSILRDLYDVEYGNWPKNKNECVLVVSENNEVSDFVLYTLGLRDHKELENVVKSFSEDEKIELPKSDEKFKYKDFLNLDMKVALGADLYEKDENYNVWVDNSDNVDFMNNLLDNNATSLKISGIVKHRKDAKSNPLSPGFIYYTPELTKDLIEQSSNKEITKQQLENKDVDVFSGKSFEDADDSQSFDMSKLISVDTGAIQSAFKFDPTTLNMSMSSIKTNFDLNSLSDLPEIDEREIQQAIGDVKVSINADKFSAMTALLVNDFFAHINDVNKLTNNSTDPKVMISAYLTLRSCQKIMNENMSSIFNFEQVTSQMSDGIKAYMQKYMTRSLGVVTQKISEQMQGVISQMQSTLTSNLSKSVSIDTQALTRAFNVNVSPDQLQATILAMMSKKTNSYDNNLSKLSYADFNSPFSIDIYAKDFDAKQVITNQLDEYNKQVENAGEADKKISYTDIIGTMLSSVRTIIDMISAMLIAFVSISLVVSSIMIGIITYVSVLERRKEIGILRAIGASKKNISQVFNAETIIEGLMSGLMGVAITALICIPASQIVEALSGVPNIASLPFGAAVILVLISVFLTFIAGLIPAGSASRKDPVEALRSE